MSIIDKLEKEAIDIIRDVVFTHEFSQSVILFSMGKDSCVLLHLFEKAFYPQKLPIKLLHVDTGYKFPEMYQLRDRISQKHALSIYQHPAHLNPWEHEKSYTDVMKTEALKMALESGKYKIAFCGARRDEEKSRAKEHIVSLRTSNGNWNPKKQNPEFHSLINPFVPVDGSLRVFPLSNWTELDIWMYIKREGIEVLPLYFTHSRDVYEDRGMLISAIDRPGDKRRVRFRTLGCWPLTGAIEEEASDLDSIIRCVRSAESSERITRRIDYDQESAMEKRKQNGYF